MNKHIYFTALLPGLVVGILNGWYWKKRGYNFYQYAFLGSIVAYIGIVKAVTYFWD